MACVLALDLMVGSVASGQTPLFLIDEIFSNADGTVQFIQMNNVVSTRLAGKTLVAGNGSTAHSFTFPSDLPAGAINHSFLVATQGFAAGRIAPDYVIPDGFLFAPAGFIGVGANSDAYTIPTDGFLALRFDGDGGPPIVGNAVATNFAGASYRFVGGVVLPPPPPPAPDPPPVPASPADVITELFSTADGKLQFIQLANVDSTQLAGMPMTTTENGVTQTFIFPATSHLPNPPFIRQILIVSQSLSQSPIDSLTGGAAEWDYVMPDGFLPVGDGMLSLGNIDRWHYGPLPADGFSALYRWGVGVYSANSSAHGVVVLLGRADIRFVTEYASNSFDRHFLTSNKEEIAALDSGRVPGWHPIYNDLPEGGTGFAGFGRRVDALSHKVCRFYLPSPSDVHFFTASAAECAEVRTRFPQFILETENAFYAGLPDPVTGSCATGLGPLYRLWNPANNDHWYTADDEERHRALSLGYVPEGYGSEGVGMCVLLTCFGGGC